MVLFTGGGSVLLFGSFCFLVLSVAGGYGAVGWLAYYIGPATLLIGAPMLFVGSHFARAAKRAREDLDRDEGREPEV